MDTAETLKNAMKIVIVGDGEVGKTCLCAVYSHGKFPEGYVPTVFDNFVAPVIVDNRPVNVMLWDTAGQEEYDRLRPLSYPNTDVVLVCFSVTSRDSYVNAEQKWIPEVRHYCPGSKIFVVGTKSDLRRRSPDDDQEDGDSLKWEDGAALADRVGGGYMECSARTQQGVKDVFETAMKSVMCDGEVGKDKKKCALM